MQRGGRLSFETGASHPPQDEAELAQNLFLTLRSARQRASRRARPRRCNCIGRYVSAHALRPGTHTHCPDDGAVVMGPGLAAKPVLGGREAPIRGRRTGTTTWREACLPAFLFSSPCAALWRRQPCRQSSRTNCRRSTPRPTPASATSPCSRACPASRS